MHIPCVGVSRFWLPTTSCDIYVSNWQPGLIIVIIIITINGTNTCERLLWLDRPQNFHNYYTLCNLIYNKIRDKQCCYCCCRALLLKKLNKRMLSHWVALNLRVTGVYSLAGFMDSFDWPYYWRDQSRREHHWIELKLKLKLDCVGLHTSYGIDLRLTGVSYVWRHKLLIGVFW